MPKFLWPVCKPQGTVWQACALGIGLLMVPESVGRTSSLTKGEQVLVVQDENPVEGWSKVRLEGDGIEGYVATRLLVE